MITRGSILWILEIVWPLYILASHLLCYVLQYCSLCNTWTINLSINLFVCLRGGELHRSVCRNQKCRTVITLGGVLVHYHQDPASRPMSVSPLSPHFPPPVLSSRTSVRYFPVVLMPMLTRHRLLDALVQFQGYALINISSPGPGGETPLTIHIAA